MKLVKPGVNRYKTVRMGLFPAGWHWREPVDSEPNPVNIQRTTADDARLLQRIAWRDGLQSIA